MLHFVIRRRHSSDSHVCVCAHALVVITELPLALSQQIVELRKPTQSRMISVQKQHFAQVWSACSIYYVLKNAAAAVVAASSSRKHNVFA